MGLLDIIVGCVTHKDEILSFAQDRLDQRAYEDIENYGVENWTPDHYGTESDPYSAVDEARLRAALDIAERQYIRDGFVRRLYNAGYHLESFLDDDEIRQLR